MIIQYVALCFVILGYLGTALIAWQSITQRDKMTYLALFFIVLGALGAVWIIIDTSRTSDQLISKSDEISSLYQRLYSTSRQLQAKSENIAILNQKIAESQQELKVKSEVIAKLNLHTQYSMTGGDSYCYLKLWGINAITNKLQTVLMHVGKYPLYDIEMHYENAIQSANILKHDIGNMHYDISDMITMFNPARNIIKIGNLPVGMSIPSMFSIELTGDHQHFMFDFITRNGNISQDLSFKRIKGHWITASIVIGRNHEVLREDVDKDFPRDDYGNILW